MAAISSLVRWGFIATLSPLARQTSGKRSDCVLSPAIAGDRKALKDPRETETGISIERRHMARKANL
ncbi:hypothetical protein BN77_3241 [Rhizobium mesoamericanum STM3625]|uniref:Uncharacterized protein n=1 Tax=Rhizobium mesoamericanum STM3625 TaxID=1211777 RepID=K0PWV1_9HYPH|nr:hypothetical protein BN77_3241 [Rhizobium mesoamericanum STM3625]